MKKLFIAITILWVHGSCFATDFIPFQPTKAGFFVGTAKYHGELCAGCGFSNLQPALGIKVQYHIFKKWYFTPTIFWNRLSGDDANGNNTERNLSFRSDNLTFNIGLNYFLGDYHTFHAHRLNLHPYIGAGIGGTFFNPKTQLNEQWIALQALETEGSAYSKFAPHLSPVIGVKIRVNKALDIRIAYSYFMTFTDYLDDVSSNYIDNATLYGQAAILADRTTEGGFKPSQTQDGIHWSSGAPRGKKGFDSFSLLSIGLELDLVKSIH